VGWLLALTEILDWAEKMLIYLKHFDERKKGLWLWHLCALPAALVAPVLEHSGQAPAPAAENLDENHELRFVQTGEV
jgi:hypothetical protein